MDVVTDDVKLVDAKEKMEAGDWLRPSLKGATRNQTFGNYYIMVTLNHLPSRFLSPSGTDGRHSGLLPTHNGPFKRSRFQSSTQLI